MNAKSQTSDAPPQAPNERSAIPDATALTMLMHRNVERMAGLQKATLDTLSSQTSDVTESVRNSLKSTPVAAPMAALFDFAQNGMTGWINAQKSIVDLIVEQSAHAAKVSEERFGYPSKSLAKAGEFVEQTIERTTTAQKSMLDFAAKQNEIIAKAFQQGAGQATAPAAEMAQSVQRGVATFIDKQKEFLDSASKMAKEAVAARS